MPEKQSVLEQTAADQCKVLPSGLTVIAAHAGLLRHPCHLCHPLWLH